MASDLSELRLKVKVEIDDGPSGWRAVLRDIAQVCTWGILLVGLLFATRRDWSAAFFYVLYAHVMFAALRKERAS